MPADTTVPAGRGPGRVVAGLTARRALRSAAIWGYVFGAYVASSALGYVATYRTTAQRREFATTYGNNAGVTALIGPAHHIETATGFTAWRCLAVLGILGAVWGLLTSTRLLRGEEDAGRWEVLLTGATTPRRATAQALAGLGAALAVLWGITAVIIAIVGRSSKAPITVPAALYFALTLVAAAGVFLAAGALASQLAATRRLASAYAGAALGVSFAVRMVADSNSGLGWLRWASPLGWIEELRPLAAPRPFALVPLVALTAALSGAAVHLAGVRDLGASTIPDRPSAVARTTLLEGPTRLALRMVRPALVGWGVAIVLSSLLLGLIAKSAGQGLATSPAVERVLARLGAAGGGATAYLGIAFLMVSLLVVCLAVGHLSAARDEESSGRLEHLLVRPVSRVRWLGGRLAVAVVAVVVAGLLAGAVAWSGAALQGSGVGLARMLAAGLNLVPPALFVLGVGALVLGLRPRAVTTVAYGVVAWSFLVQIVGGSIGASHWLLDTSVFHHMAPAPAAAPDWRTDAVLAMLGAVGVALGLAGIHRRDLAGA